MCTGMVCGHGHARVHGHAPQAQHPRTWRGRHASETGGRPHLVRHPAQLEASVGKALRHLEERVLQAEAHRLP